jgi:peptidoglycan/LPS O-acetylase OafA/YrhL
MNVRRLAELAAIASLLVAFGAVIAWPELPAESRAGAAGAILGGFLVVARLARRNGDNGGS